MPTGRRLGPDANPPERRDQSDEDSEPGQGLFNENITREELLQIATRLQLDNNTQKEQLTEVTRHRDELVTAQSRKRRRAAPRDDPTPLDHKYEVAGKRCALFWMLWVTQDLYDIEPDDGYSDARRYDNDEPTMQIQGERRDIIASIPESLVQGFIEEEHFQKVFGNSLSEQRRTTAARVRSNGSLIFGGMQKDFKDNTKRSNNDMFKELLGFQEDEDTPSRRYPCLAPVLYTDKEIDNPRKAFRSKYIKDAFRVYLFGPSSLSDTSSRKGGHQVLAAILGAKTTTAGAIAAAAILTRWAISPDPEFKPVGSATGIQWKSDYQQYKKLIHESLRAEKQRFNRTGSIGPYSQLVDEWNAEFFPVTREDDPQMRQQDDGQDDAPDIAAALAQSWAYAEGN